MIPARLKDKFEALIARYPVKRSALVPMLLEAQEELGYVSDEAIAEIARALDLPPIEVTETVSYYSMLHRHPIGKYNLQVCTNVSCMLLGAEEIYRHCRERLGIGHKQTTPDGLFSLEEVECLGACVGAPALQANYDFHENLTPEKVDEILERLRKNGT